MRRHHRAPVLLALALLACRPGALGPEYDDLLTGGEPRPAEPAASQVLCGDETYFARTLGPGEVVTVAVEVGARARLTVGGCLEPSAAGGGERATVSLELELGDERLEHELVFAEPGRWRETELHLVRVSGAGRLRIAVELDDPGARFHLRDLYLTRPRRLPPRPDPPPRQVLLISVDTLRHDAIGALGGPWETPALDRLVAASETFTRSWATASWTKPSHGSLLTGHHPRAHRALDRRDALHPALTTLAERFRHGGFVTAGLIKDIVHLDPRFGFDRGFDDYRVVHWSWAQMTRAAVSWIGDHRADPFFFFLHTFVVHSDFGRLPYEAPDVDQATVAARFGVSGYGCQDRRCASGRLALINRGELAPLPGEAEILRYLYGEGVRHLDRQLGRLLDDLHALGVLDDLLIVLTSDHGELLLEHGRTLHSVDLETVLRVPLIVKWPGGEHAGRRTTIDVSAVDVAPTLLAASGLDATDLPGEDLRRVRRRDRPIFAGTHHPLVIVDGLKLTLRGTSDTGTPLLSLHDLARDPGEERDLAAERPADVDRLYALLAERLRADEELRRELDRRRGAGDEPRPALSEEELERLRALGYVD